jgi:kumamolisin
MTEPRHILVGSHYNEAQPHGVVHQKPHPHEQAEVTVRLKNASNVDVFHVIGWARGHSLKPTELLPKQRVVKLQGAIEDLEDAFGVDLHVRDHETLGQFRSHYGPVSIPASLADKVSGVFGLDDRPVATPRLRMGKWLGHRTEDPTTPRWFGAGHGGGSRFAVPAGCFTPPQVAELYHFPAGTGEGQTIALIELGGGFKTQDLKNYWAYLGIQGPTVQAVSVDGARNHPGSDADGEVLLDIQVSGAVAPKSTIAVYFTSNTDKGFLDAISQAVHDTHLKPSAISISWGSEESSYTTAAMNEFQAVFAEAEAAGISVYVAAGDDGSSDGDSDGKPHCDFPASAPNVCGCGGTRLVGSGSTITSETVWNDLASGEGAGGGGCSGVFGQPTYQQGIATACTTLRGVPDVAAVSDPETAYVVLIDNHFQVVGGTSSAAPLLAGLTARLNQITGKRLGLLNNVVYKNPGVCNDITVGSNGAYSASVGWDPCTGLGSVDGSRLLGVLRS